MSWHRVCLNLEILEILEIRTSESCPQRLTL